MKKNMSIPVVLTVMFLTLPAPKAVRGETGREPEGGEPRHRIEIFLGGTQTEGIVDLATGLSFEFRLSQRIGLGAFLEYAKKDADVWTFGVPLYIHPYRGVRLLLAAGLEHEGSENSFLVRAGVAYEIEIQRWSITPEFNVDFVSGGHTALVYGVSFGYAF